MDMKEYFKHRGFPPVDADVVNTHVDAFMKAYEEKTDPGSLVQALSEAPDNVKLAVWCKLTGDNIDDISKIKWIHKHLVGLTLPIFGVPVGEAGIGVVPNIPVSG